MFWITVIGRDLCHHSNKMEGVFHLCRSCCQQPGGGRGDTCSRLSPLSLLGSQTGIAWRNRQLLLEDQAKKITTTFNRRAYAMLTETACLTTNPPIPKMAEASLCCFPPSDLQILALWSSTSLFKQEMTHCCRCIHPHRARIQPRSNSDSYRVCSRSAGNTVSQGNRTRSHLESIRSVIGESDRKSGAK